jgi:hypothetical protein
MFVSVDELPRLHFPAKDLRENAKRGIGNDEGLSR